MVAAVPLLVLVGVHVDMLPGDIADARDFNDAGRQQIGPTDPTITPIFDAVATYTAPDDVIAYFRARTMTLLPTGGRSRPRTWTAAAASRLLRRCSAAPTTTKPPITEREAVELGLRARSGRTPIGSSGDLTRDDVRRSLRRPLA